LNKYEKDKKQLNELYDLNGKEALIFRSKARWVERGEKPTKYFFKVDEQNHEKKIVKELKGF